MEFELRRGGRHYQVQVSICSLLPSLKVKVSGHDMDVPASICTSVRARSTSRNTLRTPCLTDVKRQCLTVLRNVGANVVLADAAIGQRIGVAFVVERGHGGDARLLEADEWASSLLVGAPCVYEVLDVRV